MAGFEAQILDKLGEVQHQLGSLGAQMAAIVTEQAKASEIRREMYSRLESFSIKGAEVDRLSPLVDKHERTHHRREGVGRFVAAGWAAASGAFASALTLVGNHLWHGPAPPPPLH